MLVPLAAKGIGMADHAEVVARAESWVGKAMYELGACRPGAFGSAGFVSYCLTGLYNMNIGTTYTFLDWPQTTDPQPGDVRVRREHCGIYMCRGQMIHAATEGVGVIYGPAGHDLCQFPPGITAVLIRPPATVPRSRCTPC